MRPDRVSSSGCHFLIGYVISVRDTEEVSETSYLQCLFFQRLLLWSTFHMERISLILELMAMFLSFQTSFGTAAVVLAILDSRLLQADYTHSEPDCGM